MKPLRVLHLISGLGQGGAETALERLLFTSARDTPWVQHEVVSFGSLGEVGTRMRSAGLSVHCLGLDRRPWRPAGWLLLWRLLRQARAETVVQTWMYHADLLGGLLARMAGQRRVVWNVRQTGLGPGDISTRTRLLVRVAARLSGWLPRAIVTNASAAILVHARFGYADARFLVIPNGFDLEAFRFCAGARQRLRQQWRISDEQFLVGLVARFDPQKDHPTFLRMAAAVAQSLPQAHFVLVGRGIAADPSLSELIAALGLGERVMRIDQRRDVSDLMSALDVFCLSSRAEGFPNVLGEAMACELPCVSTRCGDSALLVQDNERLAPVGDAAALARCVLGVATLAPEARRSLGQIQRQHIQAEFTLPAVWQRYLKLYQSL